MITEVDTQQRAVSIVSAGVHAAVIHSVPPEVVEEPKSVSRLVDEDSHHTGTMDTIVEDTKRCVARYTDDYVYAYWWPRSPDDESAADNCYVRFWHAETYLAATAIFDRWTTQTTTAIFGRWASQTEDHVLHMTCPRVGDRLSPHFKFRLHHFKDGKRWFDKKRNAWLVLRPLQAVNPHVYM